MEKEKVAKNIYKIKKIKTFKKEKNIFYSYV